MSNTYAPSKRIQSFHPPQRTLLGPGPTEIHPRVLTTMSQPAIGYLDPVFVDMMEELKSLLRYTYQTKNPLTFPISGPGSVGMEFCFVNMVRPGDKVIVARNGVFGGRMIENVERCGGTPVVVDHVPAEPRRAALRVRPCRDLDRRALRRQDADRDRAQARRTHDHGRRHVARRLRGPGRRVERRCHLLGEPEVPLLHARAVAGVVQ
jgi:hypothetical protein